MELPQPPPDQDLKNIIDKLAQFVARNGPEFEQMTKNKQRDNQKFSFLFGGEYFNYYQYKVTTEQAIIKHKGKTGHQVLPTQQSGFPGANMQNASWPNQTPPQLNVPVNPMHQNPANEPTNINPIMSQTQLQQKIQESEKNLSEQHQALMQLQQVKIEEAIDKMQIEHLKNLTLQCDFNLDDLDKIIQPIIDSCTKDAISNGKSWIFMHAQSDYHCKAIAAYLLKRVISRNAEFDLKLHIIYLMNDVIHHSVRKNSEFLKKALDTIVVPVFCNASIGADEDRDRKLSKLLKLWDTNEYFTKDILDQLKNPSSSLANYQAGLITEHAAVVQPIVNNVQTQFNNLQQQHNEYVAHVTSQFNPTQMVPQVPAHSPLLAPPNHQQPLMMNQTQQGPVEQNFSNSGNQSINGNIPFGDNQPPTRFQPSNFQQQSSFPSNEPPMPSFNNNPPFNQPQQMQGPPQFPAVIVPDLSQPPPGFLPASTSAPPPCSMTIVPSVPFYDLPAGLMVPLIKLDDDDYTPIDSNQIRLPPPTPPGDRLLAAVDLFYSAPCHERPRNSEGWEQLGLYEFFKAKANAKKRKMEMIRDALHCGMPIEFGNEVEHKPEIPPLMKEIISDVQPSPIQQNLNQRRSKSKSPPRRRYKERVSPVRKISLSRSPPPYRKQSRSPSPPHRRSRSRSRSPIKRRARSRSTTPPSFFGGSNFSQQSGDYKLDESNKGHQLLKRMGWGGSGLGASEQGRETPVDAGNIRDRQDMYKGIGVNLNDPFENFRKSKGQAFISRMKARAEESGK